MTSGHSIQTLFRSSTVKIVDYRCAGEDDEGVVEEWPVTYEIAFPRSGVYVRHDARGRVVADANRILFFNRREPYEVRHPQAGGDASTVFLLKEAVVRELLAAVRPEVVDAESPSFIRSHLTAPPASRLWHFWLLQGQQLGREPDTLGVEEFVLTLLGKLVAVGSAEQGALPAFARRSRRTKRAHADLAHEAALYLNEHACENLALEAVAGAVHCSVYHLCRVFRQETGRTLYQYVQGLRLLRAAERISGEPEQLLAGIAVDCGFASHSHLSTVFQKTFAVSPAKFRRAVTTQRLQQMRKILEV